MVTTLEFGGSMNGIIKPGDSDFPSNMFGFITRFEVSSDPGDFEYITFDGVATGSYFLGDMISLMTRGYSPPYYRSEFLCLHCGSPQPVENTHCKKCGAPRSFIIG